MSRYVKQNIGKGEELILMAKPHWIALLPYIVLIPIGIWIALPQYPMLLLLVVLSFLAMISTIINLLTTAVAFSNKKVMCKTGLINTQKMDSPLDKINNVTVTSGLFGKILGYGNIVITTAAESHTYKGIKTPEKFRTALTEQIQTFEEDKATKQAIEMAKAMNATKD